MTTASFPHHCRYRGGVRDLESCSLSRVWKSLVMTCALPEPVYSAEHKALGRFDLASVDGLTMPEGYRRSIRAFTP